MAQLALSPTAQAQLGRTSAPTDIKAARLRRAALKLAVRERRWLQGDYLPDQADRLTFTQLHKGMEVIEFPGQPTGRCGVIIGFKTIHGYAEKLPLIQWSNGLQSVSHWSLLAAQVEQLRLF